MGGMNSLSPTPPPSNTFGGPIGSPIINFGPPAGPGGTSGPGVAPGENPGPNHGPGSTPNPNPNPNPNPGSGPIFVPSPPAGPGAQQPEPNPFPDPGTGTTSPTPDPTPGTPPPGPPVGGPGSGSGSSGGSLGALDVRTADIPKELSQQAEQVLELKQAKDQAAVDAIVNAFNSIPASPQVPPVVQQLQAPTLPNPVRCIGEWPERSVPLSGPTIGDLLHRAADMFSNPYNSDPSLGESVIAYGQNAADAVEKQAGREMQGSVRSGITGIQAASVRMTYGFMGSVLDPFGTVGRFLDSARDALDYGERHGGDSQVVSKTLAFGEFSGIGSLADYQDGADINGTKLNPIELDKRTDGLTKFVGRLAQAATPFAIANPNFAINFGRASLTEAGQAGAAFGVRFAGVTESGNGVITIGGNMPPFGKPIFIGGDVPAIGGPSYSLAAGTSGGLFGSLQETFGPGIGRSGYQTSAEFADAAFRRYQQFYDQADAIAQSRIASGQWPNDPITVGARMDWIARGYMRQWLQSEGLPEGPGGFVEINRWLRDPTGSSAYRIPDVRIPSANLIMDGTIWQKTSSTPQVVEFGNFSGGNNVIIVRPTRLGGSYGIVP